VAAPKSTIDTDATKNFFDIPIESRHEEEVLMMQGLNSNNELTNIQIAPKARVHSIRRLISHLTNTSLKLLRKMVFIRLKN